MKDVIIRNMERLLLLKPENERERIEPMTEWKWQRLYKLAVRNDIAPWIAEGIKAYEGDFFLQMSPSLMQEFLGETGPKNKESLDRFLLNIDRAQSTLNKLKKESLRAYAQDIIKSIQNIEE